MMDISSLYPQPNAAPFNPLGVAEQALQLNQGVNQNKLFQAEFGGQQAWGQALAANTDPTTGVVNYGNALAQMKGANPYFYPMAAQQMIEQQRQQTDLATQQRSLLMGQVDTTQKAFGSLPPGTTQDEVLNKLDILGRTGQINPMLHDQLRNYVMSPQFAGKPGNFIVDQMLQYLGPGTAASLAGGTVQGLPDAATGRPNLTTGIGLLENRYGAAGQPNAAPAAPGTYGASQQRNAPAPNSVPGVLPGEEQARDQLTASYNASANRKALLNYAEQVLTDPNGINTGTLSNSWGAIGKLASSLGIQLGDTASREELTKLISQLSVQQGGSTDFARELGGATLPSLMNSTGGNKRIIGLLKGQEDALQKQYEYMMNPNTQGRTWQQRQQDWTQNVDPRIFRLKYMSKDELAGIKDDPRLRGSVEWAINNGVAPRDYFFGPSKAAPARPAASAGVTVPGNPQSLSDLTGEARPTPPPQMPPNRLMQPPVPVQQRPWYAGPGWKPDDGSWFNPFSSN